MHALVVGFDLDLTLVDSRPGIAAVYAEVARQLGFVMDVDGAVTRLGPPLEEEFARWLPLARVPMAVELFRSVYPEHGVTPSPLLAGARESIAAVRGAGGGVIVITGKYERNARLHLAHLDLVLDDVIGWAWAEAKAEAMLDRGVAIYVGDHPADMAAATAAGAVAVGVPTGCHDTTELLSAGADVVLATLGDFPGWFAGWTAARVGPGGPSIPVGSGGLGR